MKFFGLGKLIDFISLYRTHRNIDRIEPTKHTLDRIWRYKPIFEKAKRGGIRRNLMTSIIRQLRERYPYQVKDYSKAKKMYEDYFEMDLHIESYEEILRLAKMKTVDTYVVKFRNEYPVKGDRWYQYHINYSSPSDRILKLGKPCTGDWKDKWIYTINPDGSDGISIDSEDITCFRYATQEEIDKFIKAEEDMKEIDDEIKTQSNILSALYEKKSELNRCTPIKK